MIPYQWLEVAAQRIQAHIVNTPLTYDADNDLYIKWENHQITGSFKLRGAFNKILTLQEWELKNGLVAASAGNHGQGVAAAGNYLNIPVIIFVPESVVTTKLYAIQNLGAEVRLVAGGYGEAEQAGLTWAKEHDAAWVSPYNDGQVVAGQATLALEVLAQLTPLPDLTTWVVPVGGGGLLAGVCAALKNPPDTARFRVVGIQSTASPFMHAHFHSGSQDSVEELPSLADGLAGPIESGSITVPIVRSLADDLRLVTESDLINAIAYAWKHYGEKIEGSAAASLAAVLSNVIAERPAVVLITGGNIQPELHSQICDQFSLQAD